MNSLINSSKIARLCLKNNAVLATAVRHHWNKDYKPLPYPKTQEERVKAAEKYGLHPSEYEPYPDDGEGLGDYPKLPLISADSKDPFYPYDCPELKRNFNEPIHFDFDVVREDRCDLTSKMRLPGWVLYAQFLGTMSGLYFLYWFFEHFKMFHAATPRQYSTDGRKYYTFERES